MNNRSIYLLETYAGYLICLFLDIWRSLARCFGRRPLSFNAENGNLLFVKLIEQGALVLHRPGFQRAVETYGKQKVYLCTFASNYELVKLLNVFDEKNVILIQDKTVFTFASTLFKALWLCRKKKIEAVIDLEFFSRATAIFCYLSGAPIRAGYHRFKGSQNYRGNLFTHRLNYSHYEHLTQTSIALLQSITQKYDSLPALIPLAKPKSDESVYNYEPTATGKQEVIKKFQLKISNHRYVVITPNFLDPLPLRKWPEANYAEIIRSLKKDNPDIHFLLMGRPDERVAADDFISRYHLTDTLNLCGQTSLSELITIYRLSVLVLCSDSGPGHFATLTSIPAIVLFGPETPVLYGPKGENVRSLYSALPCSPCFNAYNNRISTCKNNVCLQSISVSSVFKLATTLLQKPNAETAKANFHYHG